MAIRDRDDRYLCRVGRRGKNYSMQVYVETDPLLTATKFNIGLGTQSLVEARRRRDVTQQALKRILPAAGAKLVSDAGTEDD